MKVVVKLSGADVIGVVLGDATFGDELSVEVRQYHADYQDPERTIEEPYWPGIKYEVVFPQTHRRKKPKLPLFKSGQPDLSKEIP